MLLDQYMVIQNVTKQCVQVGKMMMHSGIMMHKSDTNFGVTIEELRGQRDSSTRMGETSPLIAKANSPSA